MSLLSFHGPVRTHDFTLYRLAATHFGATDLPRSLDRVSPEVKEEFQAVLASAEYLAFAQSFFSLVEDECLRMKFEAKEQGTDAIIHQMPALISLVNCVGYFRGQDGMFRHAHPASVADTQKLLYQMEDRVEGLLNELIELLLSSESTKERYKERLTKLLCSLSLWREANDTLVVEKRVSNYTSEGCSLLFRPPLFLEGYRSPQMLCF